MKERPILMSAPMVRACLRDVDPKTQTRRAVKGEIPANAVDAGVIGSGTESNGTWWWLDSAELEWASTLGEEFRCPYGVVGDRLWVREAFTVVPATAYRMSEGVQQTVNPSDPDIAAIYAAGWDRSIPKWKPSIHMPRWASRLTLAITDVRVERLQDISEADAKAEGLIWRPALEAWSAMEDLSWPTFTDPRRSYAGLWNHINGSGAWNGNPFVWALTFEVVR